MEFAHLSVLALFCLTVVVTDASQSAENYWQSVRPNTPMPKALWDLLQPYSGNNLPIKAEEQKQYWTVFFEHDLHPGKKISLGFDKPSDNQPSGVARTWDDKASQPFGARTWGEKASDQPFGARTWGEKASDQPFGARTWGETESDQPFGARTWREKASDQPFGARTWGETESDQPFGARTWRETESDQPFGARTWREKASDQPFGARTWGEIESQPFGARTWREKESQPFGARTWEEKASRRPFGSRKWGEKASQTQGHNSIHHFCGKPSAIGEDKYCATSLESMMDFAISKLGKNIKMVSSSFAQNQDQYIVEEVKKIGEKAVMCHRLNFENVVFYCHEVNATTSYMVPLVASDGTKAKALTICHHDTRGMNPDVLYEVLKVMPGTVPVCHFVGNKAIAWIPNLTTVSESDHPCVI